MMSRYFSKKVHRSCGAVRDFLISSPIGEIEIVSCEAGLHSVDLHHPDDANFAPDEKCEVKVTNGDINIETVEPAKQCLSWLQDYFVHRKASPKIPALCSSVIPDGSFRARAWQLLPESVVFGSRISYGDLAKLCGNQQASRAAGQAMARNPFTLLVPCHRVVTSQGGIGNYGHGKKNKIKAWLLDFEQGQSSLCIIKNT